MTHSPELNLLIEIANLSPKAFLIYNLELDSVFHVNQKAVALFGYAVDQSEISLDEALKQVIPEDRDYVRKSALKLKSADSSVDIEFRMKNQNDELLTVCCEAYTLSQKKYLVLILDDITKTKASNEHIIEFGTKKNALLDTLTHNLSGALSMMQNLTMEASRQDYKDPEKMLGYMTLLNENSAYCIEIINDLLASEHNESSKTAPKASRFDVISKVRYIVEELSGIYKSKKFNFEFESESSFGRGDDVKMLQVIINILSNAIKFTPPDDGVITLRVSETGAYIEIQVTDNGIGIPKHLQPFVFDRKGQASRMGLSGEKSVGLGMAVSRDLVTMMGGEIWFESQENQGSTFHFTLPKN